MALTCAICSANCKKADSIICAICNRHQHIACVTSHMPNLSQEAMENITKNKPGYSFGCKTCFYSTHVNPMSSKMDTLEKHLSDIFFYTFYIII